MITKFTIINNYKTQHFFFDHQQLFPIRIKLKQQLNKITTNLNRIVRVHLVTNRDNTVSNIVPGLHLPFRRDHHQGVVGKKVELPTSAR